MDCPAFVHLYLLHHSQGLHQLFLHRTYLTFLVKNVSMILKHGIVYDAFLTCAPTVLICSASEKLLKNINF